jgi:hypothetical protein
MKFFFESPEEAARFRWGMVGSIVRPDVVAEQPPIDADPIERKEAQIEDAAMLIEEIMPTQPSAPATIGTDPTSGAVIPSPALVAEGAPLTFTELVTKYAERFGTIALHQALKRSGARRVRDLDAGGQAGLMAFITGELQKPAKPVTP